MYSLPRKNSMNSDDAEEQMAWLRLQQNTPIEGKTVEIYCCHTQQSWRATVRGVFWENGLPAFFLSSVTKYNVQDREWQDDPEFPQCVGHEWGHVAPPLFQEGAFVLVYVSGSSITGYITDTPSTQPVILPGSHDTEAFIEEFVDSNVQEIVEQVNADILRKRNEQN
jgi:hypothetical protein